jgi:hypothetical protein
MSIDKVYKSKKRSFCMETPRNSEQECALEKEAGQSAPPQQESLGFYLRTMAEDHRERGNILRHLAYSFAEIFYRRRTGNHFPSFK